MNTGYLKKALRAFALGAVIWGVLIAPNVAGQDLPKYLKDRGIGTPSSMFGTYIEEG